MLAPTGVAAINIGGLVIHSSLGIPKNVCTEHIASLLHERLSTLRYKLSGLKLIIIDEISVVSNRMLKYIHERLKQIFGTPDSLMFAGVSLIAVGGFYQLPPIKAKPVFAPFKNDCFNVCHPRREFQMIELNQIMRQQGDNFFTKVLNRIRVGSLVDEEFKILSARVVNKIDIDYPCTAMHIWAENSSADNHNSYMLGLINEPLVTVIANDQYPAKASVHDISKALESGRCAFGRLDYKIDLKKGARVMLTTNLDVEDRLINGQIGTIVKTEINAVSAKPDVIYVRCDDQNAGKERTGRSNDTYARAHSFVPIVPVLTLKARCFPPSSPPPMRFMADNF